MNKTEQKAAAKKYALCKVRKIAAPGMNPIEMLAIDQYNVTQAHLVGQEVGREAGDKSGYARAKMEYALIRCGDCCGEFAPDIVTPFCADCYIKAASRRRDKHPQKNKEARNGNK